MNFSIEVDPAFIRTVAPSCQGIDDNSVSLVYRKKLMDDGVPSSRNSFGELFVGALNSKTELTKLEIGPFDHPKPAGPNVKYFDVLNEEELAERAKKVGRNPAGVPTIHYLDRSGQLDAIPDSFDVVFSSHCIEHQIDLVSHLQQVSNILAPNGEYCLVIPDRDYCFDHFFADTTIADVLGVHYEKRTYHSIKSVIEHRALTTHNDPWRHRLGENGSPEREDRITLIKNAIAEYEQAEGGYIDVHQWQFTPQSFLSLMRELYQIGLSPFANVTACATPLGRQEFTARMRLA